MFVTDVLMNLAQHRPVPQRSTYRFRRRARSPDVLARRGLPLVHLDVCPDGYRRYPHGRDGGKHRKLDLFAFGECGRVASDALGCLADDHDSPQLIFCGVLVQRPQLGWWIVSATM